MLISQYLFSDKSAAKTRFVHSTASLTEVLPLDLQDKTLSPHWHSPLPQCVTALTEQRAAQTRSIRWHHVARFPFGGVVPPLPWRWGSISQAQSLFFAYGPPLALSPGRKGLLAVLLLCPEASDLHSKRWSQSSAFHNSTAKLNLGQSNSTDPWGRRSLTLES